MRCESHLCFVEDKVTRVGARVDSERVSKRRDSKAKFKSIYKAS